MTSTDNTSLPSSLNSKFKSKILRGSFSKNKEEPISGPDSLNPQSSLVNSQNEKPLIPKSKHIVNRFKQKALEAAYKAVNKQRVAQNKKKQK